MANGFGRPAIVRYAGAGTSGTPVWVVITGNGYNSSKDDGSRPAGCDDPTQDVVAAPETLCGQAVLYVIKVETGEIIKRFYTKKGRQHDALYPNDADAGKRRPNALGQPTVVPGRHSDGELIAKFAYAADLFGNVYRFDLTGVSSSSDEVRTLFSATDALGHAQPITSAVGVARHPLGQGTIVLFGTGQYFDETDVPESGFPRPLPTPAPASQTQSFYGIWDTGVNTQTTVTRANLLQQHLTPTVFVKNDASGNEVSRGRTSSATAINWSEKQGVVHRSRRRKGG